MKVTELRALSNEDLKKQLNEAYQELFNLKIRLTTKQLVNHRQIGMARKNIAQIKTIMKEKELGTR